VKFNGAVREPDRAAAARSDAAGPTPGEPAELDARTRDRLCREVLAQGPVTAPQLAGTLGLSQAAVRRHLDALLESGLVEVRQAPQRPRGRGRPARQFVATEAGHAAMNNEYDALASSALRFLAEIAGDAAVRRFASERVEGLEERYRPVMDAAGDDPQDRAAALAEALSGDGYAATARPVELDGAPAGTQLCQGHCPVQHVAAEFPQLCEAETAAFSRLLGVHVQRLATLAHGEHVCTTHVPQAAATAITIHEDITTTIERTS
jgi:predicted ArsR family transcriptional regulator